MKNSAMGLLVLFMLWVHVPEHASYAETRYYDADGRQVSEDQYVDMSKQSESRFKTRPRIGIRAKNASASNKQMLWTLSSGNSTIYLLGSLHVMKPTDYPLSNEIEQAFGQSDTLVFEMDIDLFNDPHTQATLLQSGTYPPGQSLRQSISESTYQAFKAKVTGLGLSMAPLNRFRPWMNALMLTVLEMQKRGFDGNYGIDNYFFRKAKAARKSLVFLESVAFQIDLFRRMTDAQQEDFLKQAIDEVRLLDALLPPMMTAWKTGDVEGLKKLLGEGFETHPEVYEHLVVERNRQWVLEIEKMIRRGDAAMVIGGCLHFIGENSVIDTLRKKGYRVVQATSGAS